MPVLDDYLNRAMQSKKGKKQKIHFFIYYSGIVVQTADTEEICGIDSQGELIPFERYCEALALYKNVFTVCYLEGVFVKDPKRESTEFTTAHHDCLLMQILPRPSFGQGGAGNGSVTTKSTAEKSKKGDKGA